MELYQKTVLWLLILIFIAKCVQIGVNVYYDEKILTAINNINYDIYIDNEALKEIINNLKTNG